VAPRDQLLELLRIRRPLLLVGSGSSRRVGYPVWPELLDLLQTELTPGFVAEGDGAAEIAESIRSTSRERTGSDHAYLALLQQTFGPRKPQHDDFHRSLIQLGCRGLLTANYDFVLESAVMAERAGTDAGFLCNHVPLAADHMFQVLLFLRAIADGPSTSSILHIHGCYDAPATIVLSESDYRKAYGSRDSTHLELDSGHRKVLWSLFVNHPIFFIGFSMDDPVLLHLLDIARDDLESGPYLGHYALLPQRATDDIELATERLRRSGVSALYYSVSEAPSGGEDHSGLTVFMDDLLRELGVDAPANPFLQITDRMAAADGS
jgi:SIR2-like domain